MELEKLIDILIKEKGGTRQQYHLLMNKIAHHESKGDPSVHQIGGGPGRGLFQFEEGDRRGGKTAANRLITYLTRNKKEIPAWLEATKYSNSINAADLTPRQQKMLYLGNMREHPKANFSKVWDGSESEEDFWAKYHWAGDKKDEFKRRKSFKHSSESFKPDEISEAEKLELTNPYSRQPAPDYSAPVAPPEQARDAIPIQPTNYKLDLNKFNLTQPKPKDVNVIDQPVASSYDQYANKHNIAAMGGHVEGNNEGVGEFNSFNNGGTHEQNPNGGIPLGADSEGTMNTVEEDETSYKFKEGKYIFSNRIKI